MPRTPQVGPQQDPYQKAAQLVLDGDLDAAWAAVEDAVKEHAREDFAPDHDADEDGEYVDFDGPADANVSNAITMAAENTSDAIWEMLVAQGVPDEAAQTQASEKVNELDTAWQKHTKDLVIDLIEDFKDGAAYSRDPHAYYGVSRKDFF